MAKKTLTSSLADKLKSAGVISPEAAEAAEQAKREEAATARRQHFEAQRASGTIAGLGAYYLSAASRGSSLIELLAWAGAWFDELSAAGHGAALQQLARPESWGAPVPLAEQAQLATALGCSLPPSLQQMLHELGGVSWGEGHTLSAREMIDHLPHLRDVLARFASPLPELAPHHARLQLIPLASVDGNYDFALRNVRDVSDESPIYFVHHDEAHLYGGAPTLRAWLESKLEVMIDRVVDRSAARPGR